MKGIKKVKNFMDEKGAVQIVEATFVFPIMFIILFFLIFMGNAHYIKSHIEGIVGKYAIEGANRCSDPILSYMQDNNIKKIGLNELSIKPYRYVFGNMSNIENDISNKVRKEIESSSSTFFVNMKPKLKGGKISKFNNYILYSKFSVNVKYDIKFPIRFLGSEKFTTLHIVSRAEVPVNDTCEFIRNTDMVMDLFEGTNVGDKISDVFKKVNDFLSNFANK